MSMIKRSVFVAVIVALLPRVSAAQEPARDQLAEDISGRAVRQAEHITRNSEQRANEFARRLEQRYEAQRGRGRFGRGPEHTEQFSRTVRLGPTGTFDLQNISGDNT